MSEKKNMRKILVGTVVSNKMEKTAVIKVDRRFKHPLYKKYLTRAKRYKVHDERNEAGVGDRVQISETRPISKQKNWTLDKILEKARI
jgi:small subunit ribosomal protein S17